MNRRSNIRKYTLFMIFIFSIQLIGLSAKASSRTVRVGVYQNNPLSFIEENGKVRGFFIDLLEYIASEEGWQIEYNHCSWPECLRNLKDGNIELLGVIAYSESRGKFFNYTYESVITNWGQFYLNKKSDIESIIDLEGKKVAVLHGDIYFENLKKIVDQFGIQCRFIEAFEYEDVLSLVEMGRCEAGMVSQFYGLQYERNYDIVKSPILVSPKKLYWATAKGKNSELLYSLDRHLKKLKKDEQSIYKQAINKWFGIGIKSTYGKWAKWIVITFPLLLILFISANVILRTRVKSRTKELLAKNEELITEINNRKQAEEALRESEERYSLAMRFSTDGVYDWNLETNDIYYSPGWKHMLGFEDSELPNDFSIWEKLTDPEDVKRSWIIQNELINKKRDRFEIEFKMRHKDGHWVDILSRANAIFDENGKAIRIIGTHVDISERKNNEKEIIRQKAKAERYLNLAGVMFIGLNSWGNVVVANQKACSILGISETEIINQNWFDNFIPDRMRNDVRSVFRKLMERKIELAEYYENPVLTKSGKEKQIAWHNTVIMDENNRVSGILSSGEDITEKRKLQEQLLQAQKMESIGNLAGGIAHDFNNILSSIIGFTEIALDETPKGATTEDSLQEVYAAGKRAKDLVKQILAFARQSDENIGPISPSSTVKEVLHFIRSTIPTTIEIHQEIESESLIMGNATQVHQVLMNLCTNAAHAMEDSGGILSVSLKDVVFDKLLEAGIRPGDYVEIKVSDTGVGIAPGTINQIFEPYFTTKGPGKGTGMGLAMVQGVVESYGGRITVDSQLKKGTTFTIYLPVTKKRSAQDAYVPEELPTGTERILLVDDEAPIAKMGSQILERLGYSVTIRTSSVDALELFQKKPDDFDLVVTDMTMPNMTGDKLAVELMKIRSDIPVILCTGYSKKMSDELASDIGIKALAYKPIVKADLANTVRKVLDESKG